LKRSKSSRSTTSGGRHHFGRSSKIVDNNGKIDEDPIVEDVEKPVVKNEQELESKSFNEQQQQQQDEVSTPIEENDSNEQTSGKTEETNQSSSTQQEVSKDTVFVSHLNPKANDGDLREFFHDYSPTDVYIFKNRSNRKQRHSFKFHQRFVSALVTLTLEDGVSKASELLNNKKLKGKVVKVQPAYISKIEDVKKAAAARQRKQEKLDEEASAAASAAAANSTKFDDDSTESKPIVETNVEKVKSDSINVVEDEIDEGFEGFENESCKPQVVDAWLFVRIECIPTIAYLLHCLFLVSLIYYCLD